MLVFSRAKTHLRCAQFLQEQLHLRRNPQVTHPETTQALRPGLCCTFMHKTGLLAVTVPFPTLSQHTRRCSVEGCNTALLGSNPAKWDSTTMAQLCWSVVTDVFDTALSHTCQQVKEGGDAPQRALANKGHHERKRKNMWEFSSCHPRCCFSSFLSCLPTIDETPLVISPGRQQILTQAAVHYWHLLGYIQGISKAALQPLLYAVGPPLIPKGPGSCGVGELCPTI